MALSLYRRHRRDCKAGHPEDLKTSDLDERRKGWKRCDCPIIASGTLQKKFSRQSTGRWEWDEAKVIVAAWDVSGSWKGASSTPAIPEEKTAPQRITIVEATDAFLAKCKNRGIQPTTYAKYKTFSNQVRAFAESKGYVYLDQLSVSDMDRFYASWEDGIRAKAKKLDRLKSFICFCRKRKWIGEDITDDLEAPPGSSTTLPKAPFTDEELTRIYAACDALDSSKRNWTGEDAKDFIYLSVYTGLRISDVATFDITKRLKGNDVFLRMHKTRRPLFTWIPTWLVERLRAREENNGPLIFRCGVSFTMKQLTDIWRNKRLAVVFKLAGQFEEKPHPHRFRHTFVRILLEKGVPIADAAELIGDTEEMLRRSYARWVPERQNRLSAILKDAFEGKPKPKIVAIR